ncbi:hypothetical protein MT418_000351 [Batrachochytrium dendrobatidis]
MAEQSVAEVKHCHFISNASDLEESLNNPILTSSNDLSLSNSLSASISQRLVQYRQHRKSKRSMSLLKCKQRTTEHINQFIRIQVHFSNGKTIPLVVDRTQTIEYIARQVEAEYAVRYLMDEKHHLLFDTDLLGCIADSKGQARLIQITQLYDSGNLGLKFTAKVGDVLAFNDSVTAVTSEEVAYGQDEESDEDANKAVQLTHEEEAIFNKSGIVADSVFALIDIKYTQTKPETTTEMSPGSLTRSNTIRSSTMDDRLHSVLHNIVSMQFFNEFCLQEYSIENSLFWIEAEIYKTIQDPAIRRTFAQYLYLTYISPEIAPLNLNISADVRKDIPWPPPECPEITMFDEVQDHAYTMIKGHAYARYEKAPMFEKFLEFKLSDRYTYIQSRVLWSYDTMFSDDQKFDQIAEIVNILSDPTSDKAQMALDTFGNGKFPSISSMFFRQSVLGGIIGRYFPLVSSIIRGYFNTTNRNAWADRQKRKQKEKKLTKFFGQRPTDEHMLQQTVQTDSFGHHSCTTDAMHNSHRHVKSRKLSMGSTTNGTASDDGISKITCTIDPENHQVDLTKRKKAEKLTEFFGESRLPKRHMKRQIQINTLAGEEGDESGNDSDDEENDNTNYPVSEEHQPPLSNQNELTRAEKRALNRRARKLRTMLGEVLDAQTVSEQVTTPLVASKGKTIDLLDFVGSTPSDTVQPVDNFEVHLNLDALDLNSCLIDFELYKFEENSSVLDMDVTSSTETVDSARMVNKLRYDKLSQVLGHRINETDVIEAQSSAPRSPPQARPLTLAEKKQFKKTSDKLERLLGATVPAQAILSYPSVADDTQYIAKTTVDDHQVSNSHSVSECSDVHSEPGIRSSQQNSALPCVKPFDDTFPSRSGSLYRAVSSDARLFHINPTETSPETADPATSIISGTSADFLEDDQSKRSKLIRLNKLRKMLGTDVKVDKVMEKQFLDLLDTSLGSTLDATDIEKVTPEESRRFKSLLQYRIGDGGQGQDGNFLSMPRSRRLSFSSSALANMNSTNVSLPEFHSGDNISSKSKSQRTSSLRR